MKYKPSLVITIWISILSLYFTGVYAQSGSYIRPYAIFKYTTFANTAESTSYSEKVKYESTYHMGYGFSYIFNATDIFGVEFGVAYENTGQKYSGTIDINANADGPDGPLDYTSEVGMGYISIPVLFNFNSRLEDEDVYLTISGGFKLNFLTDAWMEVDPYPNIDPEGLVEIKDLFRSSTASFLTSAVFNFRLFDDWFLNAGIVMSRTMGDIENKSFSFDKDIHPAEYYFPVSTKKESKDGNDTRRATKDINYGIVIGISYLFREIK